MRKYTGKRLLAHVRNGDYAHPGEEEAILDVMSAFDKNQSQQILDVGCGLGKTAHFIQQNGWGKTIGFDIEKDSIEYAKKTYPENEFYASDVTRINEVVENKFDIICIFTSFYAFHDQRAALTALNNTAKVGGYLAIMDYLDLCIEIENPLFIGRENTSPFIPIKLEKFETMLHESGWRLKDIVDKSNQFHMWYEQLLSKIIAKKPELIELFGEAAYQKTWNTYTSLLDAINKSILGGVIIYAIKD